MRLNSSDGELKNVDIYLIETVQGLQAGDRVPGIFRSAVIIVIAYFAILINGCINGCSVSSGCAYFAPLGRQAPAGIIVLQLWCCLAPTFSLRCISRVSMSNAEGDPTMW